MDEGVSALERGFLAAAIAALGAFWVSCALQYPGFGYFDEEGLISVLQLHHEGAPLPWGLFRWTYWLRLQDLVSSLQPGSVLLLRLPALLLVLAECLLLREVAQRRFGERVALWAVLANALSAATFLRSQSLLPWGATPFWALALAACMDRSRPSRLAMALCGAGASALLFEYEAWPMAAFWLVLEAWRGPGAHQGSALSFMAGAGLGFGAVLGASWGQVPSYVHARATLSTLPDDLGLASRVGRNLSALVWPHHRVGFLGPDRHPLLPPWTWAPLALGLATAWSRAPWLLAALLAALIPALSVHTAEETNRYVVAGLLACLIAGLGLGRAAARPRLLAPLLAMALLGGVFEFRAADRSLDIARVRSFARSLQWRDASRRLKAKAPAEGWELLSGLGEGDDAAFRFLCRYEKVPQSAQGRPVALLNWEVLPVLESWGLSFDKRLAPVDERSCTLFYPTGKLAENLRRDAAFLGPLHVTYLFERAPVARELIRLAQPKAPKDSLLVRTALAEMDFTLSARLREVDPERLMQAVAGPLVSAEIPMWTAVKFERSNTTVAAVYAKLALNIDPRRLEVVELLRKLKAGDEKPH